jgi:membrane protein implicated in regulation of membrane protease activity
MLFIAALLILAWFGAEVSTAQNICATSCISFQGYPIWVEVIAVAILPILLIIGGAKLRISESKQKQAVPSGDSDTGQDEGPSGPGTV